MPSGFYRRVPHRCFGLVCPLVAQITGARFLFNHQSRMTLVFRYREWETALGVQYTYCTVEPQFPSKGTPRLPKGTTCSCWSKASRCLSMRDETLRPFLPLVPFQGWMLKGTKGTIRRSASLVLSPEDRRRRHPTGMASRSKLVKELCQKLKKPPTQPGSNPDDALLEVNIERKGPHKRLCSMRRKTI